MQITAGTLKGRTLLPPKNRDIRPSASRTREAMFNLLLHAPPPPGMDSALIGQRMADLCCGSGLLGLEALSRGATQVTFIDHARESLELARANAQHLGVSNDALFLQADITSLPACPAAFGVILADPPYDKGLAQPLLDGILDGGWLAPGGYLALELSEREQEPQAPGLSLYRDRSYGKARLLVFRKD